MSTKFSTLKISDSEDPARQLMFDIEASCLPVISDASEPLGVIWHTDVLQRLQPIANNKITKKSKSKEGVGQLSDVMRVEIETIISSSPIRDAAILLQQKNCGCLLAVDGNRLIGIVESRNFPGITIDFLQDQDELKFDDLEENVDVDMLNEDDLGDIILENLETEVWNQMDV